MSLRPQAGRHGAIRAPEESFGLEGQDDEPRGSAQSSELAAEAPAPGLGSRIGSALRLGLGLALVVGTSVSVAYSVRHYALTSPRFSVQEVKLLGGKRVSPEQAQKQAGVMLGENVFALD